MLRAKFPVSFREELHQPVQAHQQMLASGNVNNMLTNTAQTPRRTIPAGNGNAGAVGCLGMSAGGSGGAEAAAPGKGGGKGAKAGGKAGGKGATDCPRFSKETAKSKKSRPMLMPS